MNWFSNVTECYSRRYELTPQSMGGRQVTVYAECRRNTEGVNGHYYWLDIYFSADEIPTREFVYGVSFGQGEMDKGQKDKKIDDWVTDIVANGSVTRLLGDYLAKEQLWEDAQ